MIQMNSMDSIAIIVAGGKGTRMGSDRKKQYLALGALPVLSQTLAAFVRNRHIHKIVLVVPEEDMVFCARNIVDPLHVSIPLHLVAGGRSRQESVCNGLIAAKLQARIPAETMVLIHDGVRPFVSDDLIEACLEKAVEKGACIPVLDLVDTVKEGDLDRNREGRIVSTLDRRRYYRAQTPQVFRLDLILKAFDHAGTTDFRGTDDASVMEHAGFSVYAVNGSRLNIKITTPEDLAFANFLLETGRFPNICGSYPGIP